MANEISTVLIIASNKNVLNNYNSKVQSTEWMKIKHDSNICCLQGMYFRFNEQIG